MASAFGKDFSTAVPTALEPDLTTALADDLDSAIEAALTEVLLTALPEVFDAFFAPPFGLADTVFAVGFAIDFADAALVAACFTFFVEDVGFCADFFIAFAIGSTMKSAVVK
ncbi:hypothetical protein Q8A64_00180 [Oxalobacteraceae bacterium R-40]|uniref:Uncharacterized protein n=1 Tax=Keguizhuia sedimenti TaxID=3064264 RepID=A0ABU1BJ37_9BURK|nr:hypothetical protein [Oxalobacteraceae bacterium R-40]